LLGHLSDASVLLFGARRIGKSTLLEDLVQNRPSLWRAVRVDLEGCLRRPVEALAQGLQTQLRAADLVAGPSRVIERVASVEVAGVGASLREVEAVTGWPAVERDLLEALTRLNGDGLIVALDEVPWWLDAIVEQEGEAAARSALASLRRIRQVSVFADRVRWVLTGSIGLAGLASSLGASAELNDLATQQVEPMTPEEGATLFETEATSRNKSCTPSSARYAARLAGGSPHWIKMLAASLGPGGAASDTDVDLAVETLLVPAQRKLLADEGSEHFRRRHPGLRRALVAILEQLSGSDGPHSMESAVSAALASDADLTRAQAKECVWLLVDGFYLRSDGDQLSWVNPLFRRWWLKYGGL
jgi:uncharacterized protein